MKKRKQSAQAIQSKENILNAAFDAFSQTGYDGTTTREIADLAGVNVSALHYHWGDKEQLWNAVCELYSNRIREIIIEKADFSLPPCEAIPDFLNSLFDALVENPALLRINLWVTLEADSIDYETTRKHMDPLVHIGSEYLKKFQEKEILDEEVDIDIALVLISAQLIYSLTQRHAHRHLFDRDITDPDHLERIKKEFTRSALHTLRLD